MIGESYGFRARHGTLGNKLKAEVVQCPCP